MLGARDKEMLGWQGLSSQGARQHHVLSTTWRQSTLLQWHLEVCRSDTELGRNLPQRHVGPGVPPLPGSSSGTPHGSSELSFSHPESLCISRVDHIC